MSYDYYAIKGEDGEPAVVHAHKDHVPEGAIPISREEAVEISAARKTQRLEPEKITQGSDPLEVMRLMVEEMARMSKELEALKNASVVVEVNREGQ